MRGEEVAVGATADAIEDPSLCFLQVPFLLGELVRMHPVDAIEAEHEAEEDDRLQEDAVSDIGVAKDDVYVGDMGEGRAFRVRLALKSALLVQNHGAPNAQAEQHDDIEGHSDQFVYERVPEAHKSAKK